MKTFLLFTLLPLLSFGQNDKSSSLENLQDSIPASSFYIKNHTVIFQKVYHSDLLKEQLLAKLKSFLPAVKAFYFSEAFGQSSEQLNGNLTNFATNYRRHKSSDSSVWPDHSSLLDVPLNANVIIQVKDYKYRITISDIYFNLDSGRFTTLNRQVIRTFTPKFKDYEEITKYLGKDLDWEFDIAKNNKISSDF